MPGEGVLGGGQRVVGRGGVPLCWGAEPIGLADDVVEVGVRKGGHR